MNEHLLKLQEKFKEHFDHVDAIAQVVLKGHLLIEESLDTILSKFVFHPEHLQNANLRFVQKMELARSISMDEKNNEMWELAMAINILRNELSHSLKSEKRHQKTQRIIDLYLKLSENVEYTEQHKHESEERVLILAASYILGFLSSFEAEVDRFKSLVGALDVALNPHHHIQ